MRFTFKKALLILIYIFAGHFASAQQKVPNQSGEKVIWEDRFSDSTIDQKWLAELESPSNSAVYIKGAQLIIDASAGVTVWFKEKLSGNIRIEYDWTVLIGKGKNDRLSDLNQFWMASDPRASVPFGKNGKFESYDSLQLYYVGFGGNSNTTTRFRKYIGDGKKPLVKEYTDGPHLLTANHRYHIVVTVFDGKTTFAVDGAVLFEYVDKQPLTEGYFAFRTTSARHAIDNFKIYQLGD